MDLQQAVRTIHMLLVLLLLCCRLNVVAAPSDDEGLDVEGLAKMLAAPGAPR
jgi:hypothetical protein